MCLLLLASMYTNIHSADKVVADCDQSNTDQSVIANSKIIHLAQTVLKAM